MNETINYYVQSRSNISLHWVYTVVAYMYLVNIVALEMANVSSPLWLLNSLITSSCWQQAAYSLLYNKETGNKDSGVLKYQAPYCYKTVWGSHPRLKLLVQTY